jgi:ubiquinone/menaquinone biosynthesis C-methylase UbiE
MKEVNEFACNHGWRRALDHYVRQDYPHIYQYVLDYGRADFAYLAPLNKQSVILDVGSGWGTLSCLLAERVGAVYSLESVRERIEFLTIRAEQEQIKNIQPIQASFLELPVPEKCLDLVILNGVFEWIGIADDSKSPDELQLMVLHKLYDCLKPGGSLYIGIENRFGYNYFLGGKDHSDLPYTSLMPRWLADNIMAAKGKGSRRTGQAKGAYRTYTYSYWGYKSILEKAGYTSVKRYLVFPDYNHPSYIVPAENLNAFRYMVNQLYSGDTRKQQVLHKLVRITAPFGLQKIFSPCFGIYAKK